MDKIVFRPEGEEPVDFYVLEQTRLGGKDYILVTDTLEGDAEALILCDISAPDDTEAVYEIVTEDEELNAVAAVFENILEDVELKGE